MLTILNDSQPLVDEIEFKKVILTMENDGPYQSMSNFFIKLCQTDWAKNLKPRPLSSYIAHIRAKELQITINLNKTTTVVPKLLEIKNINSTNNNIPTLYDKDASKVSFDTMKKDFPLKYNIAINSAEKGSIMSFVLLKCVDCSGFNIDEVTNCTVVGCPLWPIRPFQSSQKVKST